MLANYEVEHCQQMYSSPSNEGPASLVASYDYEVTQPIGGKLSGSPVNMTEQSRAASYEVTHPAC